MKNWKVFLLMSMVGCMAMNSMAGCSQFGLNNAASSSQENSQDAHITFTLNELKGEVVPFVTNVRNYLEASNVDVADYAGVYSSVVEPVTLGWRCEGADVAGYVLSYGLKEDFSDAKTLTFDRGTTEYKLENLYKGTTYHWQVRVDLTNGDSLMQKSSFQTTRLGPRVMTVDGVDNVRDVGGYESAFGGVTKQGLLYRGGELKDMTDKGHVFMVKTMGIQTEMDLRGSVAENNFPTESAIQGAAFLPIVTDGYMGAFNLKENYRLVFSEMAKEENYPMYAHCTGGADRTGTVMFLLNALLGVSKADLIRDYEFTSFSKYGVRSSKSGEWAEKYVQPFLEKLNTFEGETLAEKTENYMLSIGVTQTEIDAIRNIFLGFVPQK